MALADTAPSASVDLLDVDLYQRDPHPVLGELRRAAPLCWQSDPGFFAVLGHAEVLAVLKDHSTFSSARGTDVDDMPDDFVRSILHMDPPRHTKLRKLVGRELAPRRVLRLEPQIRTLAAGLLDRVPAGEPFDFAAEVADELPMRVLGRLIGIDEADDERFKAWNHAAIVADPYGDEVRAITAEMIDYFGRLRRLRLADPRDDVLTVLAHAQIDGGPLTDTELFGNLRTLMTGGQDTTSNLVSSGLRELAGDPGAWAALRDDRSLLPVAIEEMLRHGLGVTHLARRALADARIGDVEIPAGSTVALFFVSANRDERVFEEPDRFDIRRTPNPHLAFGLGRHFCVGAPLARLEARVLLDELLERFAHAEIGAVERLRSRVFPGIVHMETVLHARAEPARRSIAGASGELQIGAFVNMGSAVAAEILGLSGYDWLVIDLEHGAGGDAQALAQVQALAHTHVAALVRVASADRVPILRALDLGAAGVLVPQVASAEEARRVVEFCRYDRARGLARYNRAWQWGMSARTLADMDSAVTCAVQIETAGALAAVDEIAAIDGVDVLFVGPADLSNELGIAGPPDDPRLLERVASVASAAAANGKLAGAMVGTLEQAAAYRELGFTFLGCSSDSGMLVSQARLLTSGLRALGGPVVEVAAR